MVLLDDNKGDGTWERVYDKVDEAVRYFLETRHKINMGQDYWEFE